MSDFKELMMTRIFDKQTSETCFAVTKADGKEREMTIKSAGVLSFSEDGSDDDDSPKSHMTNHIDSSGYVGFSLEVAADLRVTNGAMIVVDYIEDCGVQTETMPRRALQERVMTNLFVYKVDRCTPDLQIEPEGMHDRFGNVMSQLHTLPREQGKAVRTDSFSPCFNANTQVCRDSLLTDVGGPSLSVSLLFSYNDTLHRIWKSKRQAKTETCDSMEPNEYQEFQEYASH